MLVDIESCCVLVQTMRRAISYSVWGNTVSVDGDIHTLQHPVGVMLLTMYWMLKHLVVLSGAHSDSEVFDISFVFGQSSYCRRQCSVQSLCYNCLVYNIVNPPGYTFQRVVVQTSVAASVCCCP